MLVLRRVGELRRLLDGDLELLLAWLATQRLDVLTSLLDDEARELSLQPTRMGDTPGAFSRHDGNDAAVTLFGVVEVPRGSTVLRSVEFLESEGETTTVDVMRKMCEVCVGHNPLLSWVHLLRHTTPD